jgi:esterase/lipase superfamily enzyme
MYLVTNRDLHPEQTGPGVLGPGTNVNGPHELRLIEATPRGRSWQLEVLPDQPDDRQRAEVGIGLTVDEERDRPESERVYMSRYVALKLAAELRAEKRHLVVFVHGFNNDVGAVLDRARRIEEIYGVTVVPFSWPAQGGGVRGTLSYRDDKRDAKASVGAFDRVLGRVHQYLHEINAEAMAEASAEAARKHPEDLERRDRLMAKLMEAKCPFTVNLMLHSMGNYLYKHLLLSSVTNGDLMAFDNVVLVAADTNVGGHAEWVDRIRCRGRVYVTINERDSALAASRMKAGEAQRTRLGHARHGLNASSAVYVDFTDAPAVGSDHAYFEGSPVRSRTSPVRRFFDAALHGQRAETHLVFDASTNTWQATRPRRRAGP